MGTNWNDRARFLAGGSLAVAVALLSGCMASPTYGTGKSANAQLMSDVSGILSIAPKRKPPIEYTPRPELVKPVRGEGNLPAPQEAVATAENPNWPESPEARRARLRAEADANAENPNYDSPIVPDMVTTSRVPTLTGNGRADESAIKSPSQMAAEREAIKQRMKEAQQGSSSSRKYLSEPPLEYRAASANAPVGEAGEDESKKERRLKREARKKGGGFSLEDLNPF